MYANQMVARMRVEEIERAARDRRHRLDAEEAAAGRAAPSLGRWIADLVRAFAGRPADMRQGDATCVTC